MHNLLHLIPDITFLKASSSRPADRLPPEFSSLTGHGEAPIVRKVDQKTVVHVEKVEVVFELANRLESDPFVERLVGLQLHDHSGAVGKCQQQTHLPGADGVVPVGDEGFDFLLC